MSRLLFRIGLALLSVAVADPGFAQIDRAYLVRKSYYIQTGDTAVAFSSNFLQVQVRTAALGDFDSGTLDTPGPAGQLALIPPTDPSYPVFVAYGNSYADQASLDADFPLGNYQATLTNGTTGATGSVVIAATGNYSPIVPRLSNFSALSGINPNLPFTFSFAAGLPPATSGGAAVFSVFDTATSLGFTDQGVAFADRVAVPAGVFQRGHHYIYDILFVSSVPGVDPATGVDTSQDFFVFTRGAFAVTSVPEVGTWAMLLIGFGTIGVAQRRVRRSIV